MRIPARSWKAKLSYALTSHLIAARIVRSIQEWKIDVLHVQCVSSTTWYALHVKNKLHLPLVVTLHGELSMDATHVFQHSKIHQRIMRTALREADAITACSRQTLGEAEAFYGQALGSRSQVVYNGVDLHEFESAVPFRHPRPYLFAIGRHVRGKGFDVLLRALALAGELGHDLVLAGDGGENASLKALAGSLGISHKVHFTGQVTHAEAVRLFSGCSFFVLPSRHEPFGIVNLEAMAAGKAIVASRVGGVPEFIEDRNTGLLVPAEDEIALSRALQRLAGDGVLRERLGQAGKCHARAFAWGDIVEQYLGIYEAAMGKHG